jgi:hypothetical protein
LSFQTATVLEWCGRIGEQVVEFMKLALLFTLQA